MTLAKYHDKASEIYELAESLENIAHDDGREVGDLTQAEVVAEARYVLSTFHEGGHANNEDLCGDNGDESRRDASRQVRMLNRFIRKYS